MVVADHLKNHHGLSLSVSDLLGELHKLSEQSYENKSLAFGCVLDPRNRSDSSGVRFPIDFFAAKKFKALSDGYKTAYLISTHGRLVDFVDLERSARHKLTEKHHYPEWAAAMARASYSGRCGILLSRQGDILIFDQGTLRFTYRFGQWQYWNHAHLVKLLRDRAKAKRVQKKILGRVVGAIYRAALDVSFRRSGGLFVILHNQDNFRSILKHGDAIGDERGVAEENFDSVFSGKEIQSLPRSVVVELASLDGAVVIKNSGGITAYGAVLQPKKKGRLLGSEGSRTKAAIGASFFGVAIKISSDGEISVYSDGKRFIVV